MGRLVILGLCLMAGAASAAPHTLRFRNPGPTLAYTELRTPWGTVPVSCAPGATFSVVLEIPFGMRTITAQAGNGSLVSPTSNALEVLVQPTPAECIAIPACRHDADRDGWITPSDFGSFLGVLGRSWVP
jgi:hypothetical protein